MVFHPPVIYSASRFRWLDLKSESLTGRKILTGSFFWFTFGIWMIPVTFTEIKLIHLWQP